MSPWFAAWWSESGYTMSLRYWGPWSYQQLRSVYRHCHRWCVDSGIHQWLARRQHCMHPADERVWRWQDTVHVNMKKMNEISPDETEQQQNSTNRLQMWQTVQSSIVGTVFPPCTHCWQFHYSFRSQLKTYISSQDICSRRSAVRASDTLTRSFARYKFATYLQLRATPST